VDAGVGRGSIDRGMVVWKSKGLGDLHDEPDRFKGITRHRREDDRESIPE
jgi:hypothetical protein